MVLVAIMTEVDDSSLVFDFERFLERQEQYDGLFGETRRARRRPQKDVVCKHWVRNLCKKNDACEYLHEYDLDKMPECVYYVKDGECQNPDCMFRHVDVAARLVECPYYTQGFCKRGPSCTLRHVRRVACGDFLMGFCPNGPVCKFGHPKFELVVPGGMAAAMAAGRARAPATAAAPAAGGPGSYGGGGGGGGDLSSTRFSRHDPSVLFFCYQCGETSHPKTKVRYALCPPGHRRIHTHTCAF